MLLEKGGLCSGSSGDSAAIVRQHYSNEVSIHLVKRSLEQFQRLEEKSDGAGIFINTGWLFLCPPEVEGVFRENMARLKRLGVRTWEITVDEAAEHVPGLNTEGIGRVGVRARIRLRRSARAGQRLRRPGDSEGGRGPPEHGRHRSEAFPRSGNRGGPRRKVASRQAS